MKAPDNIKPCPFCGRQEVEVEHDPKTTLHPHYTVKCAWCGACAMGSDQGDHFENWNTRADLHEAALAERDELKALDLQNRQEAWESGRNSMAAEFSAVVAECAELRKEMGRRVDDAGRLIYALSLEGRNLRQTIDQLRARLDAAMENRDDA